MSFGTSTGVLYNIGRSERTRSMPSDENLVNLLIQGDENAFEVISERYEDPIRRHLRNIVRDEATAEDLLQEVFLRVWTRAGQWNQRGPFKAWLYRVATNLALNHLRSLRRRREQPLVITDSWSDDDDEGEFLPAWMVDASALTPDTILELTEQREQIHKIIDGLPEEKRAVFRLVFQMELSIKETAGELGIPEGTVKSRLHYAKKHLVHEWQEMENT